MKKVMRWKVELEVKKVKVNMVKTKVMRCQDRAGNVEKVAKKIGIVFVERYLGGTRFYVHREHKINGSRSLSKIESKDLCRV